MDFGSLVGHRYVLMGQVTLGMYVPVLRQASVFLGLTREAKWIKPVLQTCWEVGAVPTRVRSWQAAWDSQSEEEGAAEDLTDPAAAEPSLGVGAQRRGEEGAGKNIPQRVGSKKKGEGTNQEAR